MTTIFVNNIKNNQGGNNVKVNQLSGIDTAGSVTVQGEGTATTNLQQGLCKSWIDFKGTGKFTVNFSNAMSSGDYTICGSAFYSQGGGFNDTMVVSRDTTQTQTAAASPFYLYRLSSSEAIADAQEAHILYHGDLA
jgi:hypothetical protein